MLFQTLRNFSGTDRIAFNFVSDEVNGETEDNAGNIRPLVRRRFASLSVEEENGQSHIYPGIHWDFDKTVDENFAAIPCLNDSAAGMRVIAHLVQRELKGWID